MNEEDEEAQKVPWWNRPVFGSRNSTTSGKRRWGRRDTIGLVLVILVVDFIGGGGLLLFLGTLALGWIGFLRRVVPEWRTGTGALVSGAITALIFGTVLHLCCRWWRRQQGTAWSWAGSLRLTATVLVAFAAGVCAVGIIHQSAWIGREGIYESSFPWRFRSHLSALRAAARSGEADFQRFLKDLQAQFPECEVVFPDPDRRDLLLVSDPEEARRTWIMDGVGGDRARIHPHPEPLAETLQAFRLGILLPGGETEP